jgi:hypothetical protein
LSALPGVPRQNLSASTPFTARERRGRVSPINRCWVRKHLLPRWGKLKAGAISRADVRAAMIMIEAPILANQVLAAASAIFSWTIRQSSP